jgi:hypothetical protein
MYKGNVSYTFGTTLEGLCCTNIRQQRTCTKTSDVGETPPNLHLASARSLIGLSTWALQLAGGAPPGLALGHVDLAFS